MDQGKKAITEVGFVWVRSFSPHSGFVAPA